MTADPEFSFQLVRPKRSDTPVEVDAVRARSQATRVRKTAMWRQDDPHRGLYGSMAFGIREARPDIIHAEEEPDSLAALHVSAARRVLAPRARLVFFSWQNVDRRKRAAVRWVVRRTLDAADVVICGNRGAVDLLRQFGYRRSTPLVPALALDETIFCRRNVPRLGPDFTVGYVGRLVPEKGVDTLIDAASETGAPIALAVAGAGPCRARLEERARARLGNAARFMGALSPDRVAEFLSAVDVLVVPSRSTPVWQEQFGRVIVEAMGCGVPVVGSDSGAIPDVIGDGGLIFPEGDAGALAARLRQLREAPEMRAEIGKRGRAQALATQTVSIRARQVLDVYRQALENQPSATR